MGHLRSPPPFLSLTNKTFHTHIFKGVNFASGGSGILDSTGSTVTSMQLKQFAIGSSNISARVGVESVDKLLSRSIFVISTGANDMFAFFARFGPVNTTQRDKWPLMISSPTTKITLWKFAIVGVPKIGCCPSQRSVNPTGDCIKDLNVYASKFNKATEALMRKLCTTNERMKYAIGSTYQIVSSIMENPHKLGMNTCSGICSIPHKRHPSRPWKRFIQGRTPSSHPSLFKELVEDDNASVPAIYVFGDSTADVGNNNYLPATAAKANFPHNGIDFPGGIPTGRFCNGYIGVDYLGKGDPHDAAGHDFSIVVSNLTAHMDQASARRLLSKSLFLISVGANDVFADFTQFGLQDNAHKDTYIAILISEYEIHLKKLYGLGARKFGIVGLGLLGCVPALRAKTPSGECIEDLNVYGQKFNQAAKALLRRLSSSLEGMKYSFGDSDKVASDIVDHPHLYGLKELKSACCGGDASVPAIYVFGDSSADVGNNNYLPSIAAKGNFPHNGIDFPGGVPTGRFCNGYIGVDYLAKMYGFKESPPAFLSLTHTKKKSFSGVNFASGGSGILDTTGYEIRPIPMTQQVHYFSIVVSNLTAHMGPASTHRLLSRSLFLISVGSNDISADFRHFGPQDNAHKDTYIAILLSKYEVHLKKLYGLGARKFGIVGLGLIGCVPAVRANTHSGECIEDLNVYGQKFNQAAKALLRWLSSSLEGMKYSFGDSHKVASDIVDHPHLYGLKELKSACCGGGKFNGQSPCIPNATYCMNRDQYLFWDLFHPTQATHKLIAQAFYAGSSRFVGPVTFKQLTA
ncbi:GDSL esterase/lipase [Acorus calamus]|uniref:GDSL esterase/lipase n=1 Tax=Acorus calamus TaxID=4465 RepID=A0AAV9D6X9_ACOCL|nr:GDSL esterase/lipase [Acorus calamus]